MAVEGQPSSSDVVRRAAEEYNFDIVTTYQNLIRSNPNLTKPVAAIESLIALLNTVPSTTAHEMLSIVKAHSDHLYNSLPNPIPRHAGTDLFTQYIVSALKERGAGEFEPVRQHLLRNGELFVNRAIESRKGVAEKGWRVISEGDCIMTSGASRVVTYLFRTAVSRMGPSFKVVYVRDSDRAEESDRVVAELKEMGLAVAEIPQYAEAYVLRLKHQISKIIVGAEVLSHNGGAVSRMGTFQLARLAKHLVEKPFYVAAETHKFSRKYVLEDQEDMRFDQGILNFSTEKATARRFPEDAVDFTPPNFIDRLITEDGVKLPGYVMETVLDTYGTLGIGD